MNYLKCVVAGCAASILSGIVFILVSFAISLNSRGAVVNFAQFSEVSIEFTAGPLLLVVLLAGFAIGFFWMRRKS